MKISLYSISFAILFIGFVPFSFGQTLQFNVPNSFCLTSQPLFNTSIKYTVDFEKQGCVAMYGSTSGSIANNLSESSVNMAVGLPSTAVAIAKLASVSTLNTVKSYNFGAGCAEQELDNANVFIQYAQLQASPRNFFSGVNDIDFPISAEEVLTVNNNSTPDNPSTSEAYLKVEASIMNTATINIANNSAQGQVFVVIFRADGQRDPLTVLDPKSTTDLSYTVAENVYVVPFIRPKLKREAGVTFIDFEVGDPVRNGKIIIEEE